MVKGRRKLNNRWAPAVLETEEELLFIKVAQRSFTDIRNYWIGGSTAEPVGTLFPFSSYEIGNRVPKNLAT